MERRSNDQPGSGVKSLNDRSAASQARSAGQAQAAKVSANARRVLGQGTVPKGR